MKETAMTTEEFYERIRFLLDLPELKQMDEFIQHGTTTCLEHCLTVTYYSYVFSRHFNLKVDYESLVRGALLHDFFLYDWHIKENHQRFHGFRHPTVALNNAAQHFELTPIECDIIKHHMWPLTLSPPRTKEAYVVTLMDKWCSLRETLKKPMACHLLEKH